MIKSLLLALSFFSVMNFSPTVGDSIFVLSDSAYLYSAPSLTSEIVVELEKGDELSLVSSTQTDGFWQVVYQTDLETYEGFVYSELAGPVSDSQEVLLSCNATIINSTQVLSISSLEPVCQLEKGTRVFLYEGYDDSKDYLAIRFENDGQILTGQVRIEDVQPDGVNAALIVAITAIVAIVSIIIILLGITKKKRHKKLKTEI